MASQDKRIITEASSQVVEPEALSRVDELVAIMQMNQGGIDWSVWATISNALFG